MKYPDGHVMGKKNSHQKCFPEYVGNSFKLLSLRFVNGLLTIGFTPKDLLSTRFVSH